MTPERKAQVAFDILSEAVAQLAQSAARAGDAISSLEPIMRELAAELRRRGVEIDE